ncbi:hypothetical protein [Chitinophaga sp. YIM B06452]|uniref:hypothetical protein n=1 Tax=Chitinophaga sp. YIM B06452 TaxID=3082158 RepID=UPI0031FEB678
MKLLRFNFLLILALTTTSVTLFAYSGKRALTACYGSFSLRNADGTAFYTPVGSPFCSFVPSQISAQSTYWLAVAPLSQTIKQGCTSDDEVFCCIEFDIDPSAPAGVPTITVGTQTGKFKVINIKCRPSGN